MGTTDKKMTSEQAAERIGISPNHLGKMRMTGEGPVFLKIGRKVLYEVAAVDAWLDSKRTTKNQPSPHRGRRFSPGRPRKAVPTAGRHASV